MHYRDKKPHFRVRVEQPESIFAPVPQQAIAGVDCGGAENEPMTRMVI
jgi:hypothetical protein